jgi:hypothetical protein
MYHRFYLIQISSRAPGAAEMPVDEFIDLLAKEEL